MTRHANSRRNHEAAVPRGPNARVRAGLVALAVAIWLVGQPALASAQPGWSGTAESLFIPQPGGGKGTLGRLKFEIAVDAAGNATAVWHQARWDGQDSQVRAARYSSVTRTWSSPVTLDPPSSSFLYYENVNPRVIVDPASGDAIVMWARVHQPRFSGVEAAHAGGPLRAVRYSITSGVWTDAVDVSAPGQAVEDISLGVDPAGNVFAIWRRWNGVNDIVQAARFMADTETWNPPVDLSGSGQDTLGPRVAIDSLGNAVAVWSRFDGTNWVVQSSRYAASADLWSAASDVSIDSSASSPELVIDSSGNATAAWSTDDGIHARVQVRRYLGASQSWGPIVNLSTTGDEAPIPRLDIDALGNVFAVWRQQSTTASGWSAPFLQASRFSVAADAWLATVTLSPPGADDADFELIADARGNAVVVWKQQVGAPLPTALQAVRYVAATQEWVGSVAVNEGGIGLHRTAVDTEGNILVVWVSSSSVNALRAARFAAHEEAWTPADVIPASTGSSDVRVVFDRLNNATVVWRWSQADSAPGLKSTQWLATQPPRDLFVASLAGNLVTLHWTAPNTAAPTGYVLEGGLNPGEVLASIPTNSAAPTFTFVAPTGAFFIRVRAVTDSSRSVPSNEIRIFVNVPVVPSAPANLLGLVNGTDIALSWNNTFAGGAPTSLWLTVHGPITTALPLPMGEAFSYANVPLGTYTLSVVAANASGVSAPSNEVTLTVPDGCSGVPAAPMNVQTWKVGTTIFLSWDPPALGPAVTSYTVAVTGAYFGFFETPERSLSGAAPPGSYALSVMARNVCGAGPRTLEQTVEVP